MVEAAPSLTGEIVGRRAWRMTRQALLGAVAQDTIWTPGENEARCLWGGHHAAPTHQCSCGLYAYYDPHVLNGARVGDVWGVITAWGRVEAHPLGFRAERARVAALVSWGHSAIDEMVERAASVYQVPLITPEQFCDDSFISEYGQVVPRELRPEFARDDRSVRLVGAGMRASVFAGAAIMTFGHTFWGLALPIGTHLAGCAWRLTR